MKADPLIAKTILAWVDGAVPIRNPLQQKAYDRLREIAEGQGSLPKLLTSSAKTLKGEKKQILTGVLYLAASNRSGYNVCPRASWGCIQACLGHESGRMRFSDQQRAQVIRTWWRFASPRTFYDRLNRETANLKRRAKTKGYAAFLRLNGTSDLEFSFLAPESKVPEAWEGVTTYDYTKRVSKALHPERSAPEGYHVTYSASEQDTWEELENLLREGANVALVTTVDLGTEFRGFPVLDGDETDARPTDTKGAWVRLSAKGRKAKQDTTGFVYHG